MNRSWPKPILFVLFLLLLGPGVWATQTKDVAYQSGDDTVHGVLFVPPGKGPFPGLLAIHAVFGLDVWTKEQCKKLADAGYVVLAPDLYRGRTANSLEEGMQIVRTIPTGRGQRDLVAAMSFLRAQPNIINERLASIGWCMGGTLAFQLATLDPQLKAAVIRYGHVSADPVILGNINAPILGIFGAKDISISVADIRSFERQMKTLNKQVKIVIYPEAGHAFEYPEAVARNFGLVKQTYAPASAYQGPRPSDTADAWKQTLEFLDANLKSKRRATRGVAQPFLAVH